MRLHVKNCVYQQTICLWRLGPSITSNIQPTIFLLELNADALFTLFKSLLHALEEDTYELEIKGFSLHPNRGCILEQTLGYSGVVFINLMLID